MQFNKTLLSQTLSVILALGSLTLAGCGSDSSSSITAQTTQPPTEGPTEEPTTEEPTTEEPTTEEPTTEEPTTEEPTEGPTEGPTEAEAELGYFHSGFAAVAGISFDSGTFAGVTDSQGTFSYAEGEQVTFTIGNITLGIANGSEELAPTILLGNDSTLSAPVQNMNRLLEMLDSDRNVENGISVYPAILEQAINFNNVEFDSATFDSDVAAIVEAVMQIDPLSGGLPPIMTPTPFSQVSTVANLQYPWGDGITMNSQGDVLLSGGYNMDNILKVTAEGEVSTLESGLPGPVGMGYDSHGNLFVANYSGNSITKISPDGNKSTFATNLDGPAGLLVRRNDEILVSLYGAKFSGVGATVLKFDQQGNKSVYASGHGLRDVIGLAEDEKGRVFVANWQSGKLFKIANNTVEHIATVGDNVNQITYANGYVYLPATNHNKIYRAAVYFGREEDALEMFAGTGMKSSVDGDLANASFYQLFNATASSDAMRIYVLGKDGKLRVIE